MRVRGLTDRQFAALACVAAHIRTHGFPPTLREIGAALNIGSTNGVNDHLKALTHKGYIARDFMASRGIRITAAGREALGSADSDAARELERDVLNAAERWFDSDGDASDDLGRAIGAMRRARDPKHSRTQDAAE